jgi:hypothetical protein
MVNTNTALEKSQAYMVLRLSHLSTYTPARGPIKNTGIMVKERILAISIAEPGAFKYTKPIKAIWPSLSPICEIIWPSHKRKKLRFFKTPINFDIN